MLQGSCSESCYLAQRAILLATDSFHVLGKFDLDVTKLWCCKDTLGSRSLHYDSIGSREEKMSNSSQKSETGKEKTHILLRHLQLEYLLDSIAGRLLVYEFRVSLVDGPVLNKYLIQ